MIDDFFTSEDPATQADLDRIHALVCSETFLQGLGMNAHMAPSPEGFPVITDIARASELMLPRELYELPEPWPYQDFYGAVEVEVSERFFGTAVSKELSLKVSRAMDKYAYRYEVAFPELIETVLKREKALEQFLTTGGGGALENKDFELFADTILPEGVDSLMLYIVQAAYYCGVDNSPVFKRLLEAFETGGVPCGWLGTDIEDGGDPGEAIALLHFGQGAQG